MGILQQLISSFDQRKDTKKLNYEQEGFSSKKKVEN